jgi:hypothetical protein
MYVHIHFVCHGGGVRKEAYICHLLKNLLKISQIFKVVMKNKLNLNSPEKDLKILVVFFNVHVTFYIINITSSVLSVSLE